MKKDSISKNISYSFLKYLKRLKEIIYHSLLAALPQGDG